MTRFLGFRRHALGASAALALLATPIDLDAQRPKMPRVRPEPCSGYCKKTWASCARIRLRAAPSEKAAVSAVLDSGVRVTVIDGQRHTVSPGVVVVQRPITVIEQQDNEHERFTPKNPARFRLRASDTLYVVDRVGDGDSYANFVWIYRGREVETAAFWPDRGDAPALSDSVRYVRELHQVWWNRVEGPAGKIGWTRGHEDWTGTSHYDDPVEKCAK